MSQAPKHHGVAGVIDAIEKEETPGGESELRAEIKHDYSSSRDGIVPLSARRGTWSHHVPLWLTLYAGFAYMSLGSELWSFGYTLQQVMLMTLVSGTCYLLYAIPAAYLGAWRGQTHALMSRSVFGRYGSILVSILVLVTPLGWVGYQAGILADIWNGLFGWGPVVPIAIAVAVFGIANNILGFTGIAAFARWIASPLILAWVIWMVFRTVTGTSGDVLASHLTTDASGQPLAVMPFALGIVFSLGFATYGNEPDLFRYAKPKVSAIVPPLFIGLLVGQFLFPMAGWIIAARIQDASLGAGVAEAVKFSLGGLAIIAFFLVTPTEIAINDANYYESLNAGQNLFGGWSRWKRIYTCVMIAAGGGVMAWWVPQDIDNFFRAVTFLAVTVPTATVIMYTDQLLLPKLLGITRNLEHVPSWNQAATANWPAIVALVVGIAYGSYGSGILPGQSGYPLPDFGITGVIPVEAWLLAAGVYIGLTAVFARGAAREKILGFPTEVSLAAASPTGLRVGSIATAPVTVED